jgi:hypothetical protein
MHSNVGASLLAIGPSAIPWISRQFGKSSDNVSLKNLCTPRSSCAFLIAAASENQRWCSSCRTIFTHGDEMQLTVVF